jgi:hypothetical protein
MSTSRESQFSVVAEVARRLKQDTVARHGHDPDESMSDLMGFCAGVRGGKQDFLVYHGPGTMSARQCIYYSAVFLPCDEIFLVADCRFKVYDPGLSAEQLETWQKLSAQEREEWFYRETGYAPGQINAAWESGERAGMAECLVIYRFPLLGPTTGAQYIYERTGTRIKWTFVHLQDEDQESGAIRDHFQAGQKKRREIYPEIAQMAEKVKATMCRQDFSAAEAQYWIDRGLCRYLSGFPSVFLVHYNGSVPELGLEGAVFKDGAEIDPNQGEKP